MTQPVVVTGRRRPHQVGLLAWSLLLGLTFIAGWAPPPGTVNQIIPDWVQPVWYALMLASGAVGSVAIWLRDIRTGMLMERAALLMNTAALLIYVIPIMVIAGKRGLGGWSFFLIMGLMNIWRLAQITDDLRKIRRAA